MDEFLCLFPFVSSVFYRGEIQIFWFVKLCFLASGKYYILTGPLLLPMHVSFRSKDNLVSLFFQRAGKLPPGFRVWVYLQYFYFVAGMSVKGRENEKGMLLKMSHYTHKRLIIFQKGLFLDNFQAEIYYLCKQNNYPLPSFYQGMYNSVTRLEVQIYYLLIFSALLYSPQRLHGFFGTNSLHAFLK